MRSDTVAVPCSQHACSSITGMGKQGQAGCTCSSWSAFQRRTCSPVWSAPSLTARTKPTGDSTGAQAAGAHVLVRHAAPLYVLRV
jgi:hypothetical protein